MNKRSTASRLMVGLCVLILLSAGSQSLPTIQESILKLPVDQHFCYRDLWRASSIKHN